MTTHSSIAWKIPWTVEPGEAVGSLQPGNVGDSGDTGLISGSGDLLEEEMTTHSSIAWKIPWTVEPGEGSSPWGRKELDMTEVTEQHGVYFCSLSTCLYINTFRIIQRREIEREKHFFFF